MNLRWKFLSFLVPALAAVIFLVWWLSPTQQVKRAAERVIDAVEIRALSSKDPEERAKHFVSLLTDPVMVAIEGQIRGQSLTPEDVIAAHEELQARVTSCRVSVEEAEISFPASGEAEFRAPIEVQLRAGPKFRKVYRYDAILSFRKSGKNWLLSEVLATAR